MVEIEITLLKNYLTILYKSLKKMSFISEVTLKKTYIKM